MCIHKKAVWKWMWMSCFAFVFVCACHIFTLTIFAEEVSPEPVQTETEVVDNTAAVTDEKTMPTAGALDTPMKDTPVQNVTELYLNGQTGNDANDGTSIEKALKTFEKAREKATSIQTVNTIYVTDTVDISGDVSLKGTNAIIKRHPNFNGYLFNVKGTATLSGITVDENSENCPNTEKSLIKVLYNQQLNIQDGAILQNNKIKRPNGPIYRAEGGAIYAELSTINMMGGIIQNNQACYGGGILLNFAVLNMSGGTIRNNSAVDGKIGGFDGDTVGCGGGIGAYVQGMVVSDRDKSQTVINLSGGLIQDNNSEGPGGGISLGYLQASNGQNILNMTGGRIDGNRSGGCGGGIFVQAGYSESYGGPSYSVATITGGYITNNQMLGTNHKDNVLFGGGGIYVNGYFKMNKAFHDGVLQLNNAIITDNTATLDGGGYAACPVSITKIYLTNGVALYGNQAKNANEIYILASSTMGAHSGNPKFSIMNAMLGGHPYYWKYQDGTLVPQDKLEGSLIGLFSESLSLHTDEVADAMASSLAKVWITGNTSTTRGGGIGSNGSVTMGDVDTTSIAVEKQWDDQNEPEKRPSLVELDLYRTDDLNEEIFVGYGYIKADENGQWHYVFTNLPTQTATGSNYHYRVKEKPLEGYMYTVDGNEKDGYLLTNHLSTQIHVQKVWNGKKADFVKVELLANGQRTNVFITLHAENQWAGSFVDLRKYDENGQRIQYTIYEEINNDVYETSISGNMEEGFIITNIEKKKEIESPKQQENKKTNVPQTSKQVSTTVQTSTRTDITAYGSLIVMTGLCIYFLMKQKYSKQKCK